MISDGFISSRKRPILMVEPALKSLDSELSNALFDVITAFFPAALSRKNFLEYLFTFCEDSPPEVAPITRKPRYRHPYVHPSNTPLPEYFSKSNQTFVGSKTFLRTNQGGQIKNFPELFENRIFATGVT